MNQNSVILKPGKEKALRQRHHWIFSGAVHSYPKYNDGDLLPVVSSSGTIMGTGYFNRKGSIVGRMVSFGSGDPLLTMRQSIEQAIAMRTALFNPADTNAYRLINGEGDLLPGLIVDRYNDCLVIQLTTCGMDQLRPWIVSTLDELIKPRCIYEKSTGPSRREDGLSDVQGIVKGEFNGDILIKESGLQFHVNPEKGQKTGFFLDHREMRRLIGRLSKGKRVLNCFSYTGGFSVHALAGGAARVDSVDISQDAIDRAKRHVILNGFDGEAHGFYAEDVFEFLRQKPMDYDLVILDPPAFAKKKRDIVTACRGYKDINRVAMQKMPRHSILLTSSCSYHVDEALFQNVVFQAAAEANRTVKIIGRHQLAADHPINLCHPEGDYLKSLVLYIV